MHHPVTESNHRVPDSIRVLRITAMFSVLVLGYGAILQLLPSVQADQRVASPPAGTMADWPDSAALAPAQPGAADQSFPAEPLEVYSGQVDWTPPLPGTRNFE